METKIKIDSFEYVISKLLSWYKEISKKDDLSSFTKLKLQKLLFLLSAVNATEQDRYLLNIFDNFYAMRHGPVESDIYNAMVENKFPHISFMQRNMTLKQIDFEINISEVYKKMIDCAINQLKEKNNQLVVYPASVLVDITHKWKSWKDAMDIAITLGKGSEKIETLNICNDIKIFK